MAVARPVLGVVVGRGKETKNRIERESGAHIQMLPPAADSETEDWTCRITGGHEETAVAARIIQELMDTSEVCTGNPLFTTDCFGDSLC